MPRIRSSDFVLETADVSSLNVVMPQPHVAGDVFFCVAIKDSVTTAGPTTASTGWFQGMATSTSTGGTTTNGGLCSWFVKVATSSSEPDLVITQTDPDSITVGIIAIKGCGVSKAITGYSWSGGNTVYTSNAHGFQVGNIVDITGVTPSGANGIFRITAVATNTFTVVDTDPGAYSSGGSANCIGDTDGANGTIDSTGAPYGVPGVTTKFDKSMVVYTLMTGGTGCPVHYPGLMGIMAVDTATEGLAMAYKIQKTAGASGTFNFYTNAVNTANLGVAVSFRDSGVGEEAAYFDTDWATLIHPFRGSVAIVTGDVWGTALTNYPTAGKTTTSAVFQVDQSGGPSYVDYTTASNNSTDADVVPFPATEAAGAEGTGDWFAIGHTKPFAALTFDTLGCTAGVGGVIVWEYWDGTAWSALAGVTDGTTGFTATAADGLQVRWNMPAKFNWTTRTINGSASLFYVRARCSTLYTTNPTISQIYISGQSLVYDAVAASTDSGVIPWEDAASITGALNTSQISGTYIDLGQTVDISNSIICGTYMFALPRDYVDSAKFKEGGGVHVMFGDTSFNRKHWCVGSFQDAQTQSDKRNRFAIDWAQSTDTTMSRTTTDPSNTIADVFIGNKCLRGAGSIFFSHMIAINPTNTVINGGSSTYPITVSEFLAMGDASPVQLFRDSELLVPVTFGGTDYINAYLDGFTFTFPEIATPWSSPYSERPCSMAHYDSGKLGFIFDARSGDSCKLTNGKITSRSPWQFTVTATASSGATWSFDGMLVENALVTLRPVFTWNNIKWQSCTSFVTNGATMTNQTFVNTKVSVSSPANAALISSSSFTKTTGTQHALEVSGTAADFTLSGLSFTGYAGSNGSTGNEAIYINIASGSLVITIIGGGSTPSIRTAGCTVTISNPKVLTLTSLITGSDIIIKTSDTNTALANIDQNSGSTYAYNYTYAASTYVDISVMKAGYKPWNLYDYLLSNSDASLPISQVIDRDYV